MVNNSDKEIITLYDGHKKKEVGADITLLLKAKELVGTALFCQTSFIHNCL